NEAGKHLAVAATEIEHASAAEGQAPGPLEQSGEDAGALVHHGTIARVVRGPLARASAALCVAPVDAPHPDALVREEFHGHHATAAGVPVGASGLGSPAHPSAVRARVQSNRSRAPAARMR